MKLSILLLLLVLLLQIIESHDLVTHITYSVIYIIRLTLQFVVFIFCYIM